MSFAVFISYGGPDEKFAAALDEFLRGNNIDTFFFPKSAQPGDRLYRVMRNGIEEADKVVCVCSKTSLGRPGVLNEIDLSLAREAREGASTILMPITLDDYVFSDWEHANAAIVGAVRDRVIADFSGVRWEQEGFEEMGRRLIDAILNDKEYIVLEDMASIQFDDDYGHVATVTERKKIIINSRKFSRVRFPRATFDGVFSVKHTVPPAFDLGRDQSVKALEVIFNEAPAVGSVVQAEVAFNCVGSFSSAKEFFGLNALQTIRRGVFSMTVPAKRRILKCVATLIHRGIERDVSDKLFVDDRHVSVEIAPMPVGSRLVVEWLW